MDVGLAAPPTSPAGAFADMIVVQHNSTHAAAPSAAPAARLLLVVDAVVIVAAVVPVVVVGIGVAGGMLRSGDASGDVLFLGMPRDL